MPGLSSLPSDSESYVLHHIKQRDQSETEGLQRCAHRKAHMGTHSFQHNHKPISTMLFPSEGTLPSSQGLKPFTLDLPFVRYLAKEMKTVTNTAEE